MNADKHIISSLFFHRARIQLQDNEYLIIMNNSLLLNITTHKYLVVFSWQKMSSILHIAHVKNNVLSTYRTPTFSPYLIYCVESCDNAPKCHVYPLFSLHLSSIVYHLSSIIYHLSSIIYHLSSIIYHLSSIIYHLSSQFIFREPQVLPLYNFIHNRIGSKMHKLLNDLLPDIMSELCMVKIRCMIDHLTRQSHFLHTRKGIDHVYIQMSVNWEFPTKED